MLAGVSYNLFKQAGDLDAFDDAIAYERHALEAWGQMVAAAGGRLQPQPGLRSARRRASAGSWKEEYQLLGRDFEQLLAERQTAAAKEGSPHLRPRIAENRPPSVKLLPVSRATQGRDVEVSVSAPEDVKWIRLRYRHLTQFEDYATAEMTLDPKRHVYTGRIPAAFVDPKWELMYFVEVVDKNRSGRMYPDLDVETPYVIVPVAR